MNRNIARLLLAVALVVSLSSSAAAKMDEKRFVFLCNGGTADEVLKELSAGASVHSRGWSNYTPLHMAALNKRNPEVTTVLLNAGADVNARDKDNFTPLHLAAMTNHPEVVTALLKAGSDVNAKGKGDITPLLAATMHLDPEAIIMVLLQAGADVNAKDAKGRRAIEAAEQNEKLQGTPALEALRKASE